MECPTCRAEFANADTLSIHVALFKSREAYLIEELRKCFQHAGNPQPEKDDDVPGVQHTGNLQPEKNDTKDIENDISVENSDDKYPDNSDEEEEDSDTITAQDELLQCPRLCKEQFFKGFKLLARHFATHVSCNECCPFCSRAFDQASSYLHHRCKKGRIVDSVREQRRKIRGRVKKELKIAIKKRKASNDSPVMQHKRNKNEMDDDKQEVPSPSSQSIESAVARELLNGLPQDSQAERTSLPNAIGESLRNTQTRPAFPYIGVEHGSEGLDDHSNLDFRSQAPAMYPWPVFGSDLSFQSMAPAMHPAPVFGSDAPASYLDFMSIAPVMHSDIDTAIKSTFP